ncbi:hypothetical protein AB0K09_24435 [Streptomyces sp. NPDC049577]|uniref:hypothetical protein n=1 Tax=Streptomyces sp. NPDC049577 TaxID=3155153 RepID=UPI00341992EF
MFSVRNRIAAAAAVAVAASAITLGQASTALADGPGDQGSSRLPAQVTYPAPGKITQEHKVTNTYQYDPKASGSSSDQSSSSSSPSGSSASTPAAPEPGPVTNAKDTVNSAVSTVASGTASTADSALK